MNISLKFLHQLIRLTVVAACLNITCFGARADEPQRVLHSAMALQLESLEITHLADFRQWVMRRLNAESKDGDALNDLHQRLIAALREVNELERAALERAVSLHELVLLGLTKSAQARAAGSAADDAAQSINQIQANLARARQMVSSDLKRIENRDAALARESQSLEARARRLESGESSGQVTLRMRSEAYNSSLAAHEARVRKSAAAYRADVDAYNQWLERSRARLGDLQTQIDEAFNEYQTFAAVTDKRRAQLNTDIEAYNALVASKSASGDSEESAKAEQIAAERMAIRNAIGRVEQMALDVRRLQDSAQSLAQRLQAESEVRSGGLRARRQAELDEEQIGAERLVDEREQIERQASRIQAKLERAASVLNEDVKRHQEMSRLATNSGDREFYRLASQWLAGGDVDPLLAWLSNHRQEDRSLHQELDLAVDRLQQLPSLRIAIDEANKLLGQARAYAQDHSVNVSKSRTELAAAWKLHAQARTRLIEAEHRYEGRWRRWLAAQSTFSNNVQADVVSTLAELMEADLAALRGQLGFGGPSSAHVDAKRTEFSDLAMDYGIDIADWGRAGVIALLRDTSSAKGRMDAPLARRLKDWLTRAETKPWLASLGGVKRSRELLLRLLEVTLVHRAVLRETASSNVIEAFLGAGQVVLTMDGNVRSPG